MYNVLEYNRLRDLGLRGVDEKIPKELDPCWVDDSLVYAITETYHVPKYFDGLLDIFATQIDQVVYNNFAKSSKSRKEYTEQFSGWIFDAIEGQCKKYTYHLDNYLKKTEYPIYLDFVPFTKTINLLEVDSRNIDNHKSIVIVVNIDLIASELYGYKLFDIVNRKPIDFNCKEDRERAKANIKVLLAHEFLHVTERFFNPNGIDPVEIDRHSKTLMSLKNKEKVLETIGIDAFYRVNNLFYAFSSTEMNARISELHQRLLQDKDLIFKKLDFQVVKDLMRSSTNTTWTHIMLAWVQDLEKVVKEEKLSKEAAYAAFLNKKIKRFKTTGKNLKVSLKDIAEDRLSEEDTSSLIDEIAVIAEDAREILNKFESKVMKEIFMTLYNRKDSYHTETEKIVEKYSPMLVFDMRQYVFLFEGLRSRI